MNPRVKENKKTALPAALIFGSNPVTSDVQILMGKVISKLVKKYAITNSSKENVKVNKIVANMVGAQMGTKIKTIRCNLPDPKEIPASSIDFGILSILFFKLITANGKTYRVCPTSTNQSAGSIPTETI